jgi:hypothetical protein
MATLTGSSGALRFRGRVVAKVRNYAVSMRRDALEDTCVGDDSRTYVQGLFGATGQATLLLDRDDEAGRELLNSIFTPETKHDVEFVFDRFTGQALRAKGFLTDVGASVAVGDTQSASVTFQLSGGMQGSF